MTWPTKEHFNQLCLENKIIPMYKCLPLGNETPVSVYERIGGPENHSFVFESGKGAEKIARYSFVGGKPFLVFKSKGNNINLIKGDQTEEFEGAPLKVLKEIMDSYQSISTHNLPHFFGGAIGYFSYDLVRQIEKIPNTAVDELEIPEVYLLMVDWVYLLDHQEEKLYLVVNVPKDCLNDLGYQAALEKIDWMEQVLSEEWIPFEKTLPTKGLKKKQLRANLLEEEFAHIVSSGKEYIAAGDIFQVNLSVRLYRKLQVPPYLVFKYLRKINPSPYGGYMKLGEIDLISSSPELLVRVKGDVVETRPIAGTRRRGENREEDLALTKELLSCAKENAEHIMLVDLERNDLGRVCDYGTVEVDELMVIEEYSHVIHIVSNVKGRLHRDKDRFDVIKATFPGGTITGAPKVRCMEIIEELEGIRRGIYTGSMGWLNFSGDMELNIAIRTIVVKDELAYIQAGAGIVADSDPYREYHESMKKAEAMVKAIEITEEAFSNDFNDR
ncbi:MAG: anthranilate synthase component I [Clostridia bacterium]|nr:anthranilate synthase component I [Clostridia bacterium]